MISRIDVQVQETSGALVAKVVGKAGVDEVEEFDRQLHLLTVLRPRVVVLDLSATTYLSSMGIGSLLRFHNELLSAGGKVVLSAAQKGVADVLRLGNIERVLKLYPNVDAALSAEATGG